VGPRFTLFSVLYLALALVAHYVWYPLFVMQGIPYALLIAAGVILIAIGVPIWVTGSKEVDRAYEGGYLATQGVYALCRHPIYGNAIFFTIPSILLFFRSWLLLTVPVAMYVIFRVLIGEEETYLREAFGEAYVTYAKEVNLAFPRLWKLRSAFWYPTPTGQVAERVYAVTAGDASMFIYADGEHAIATDAGYGGQALQQELERIPADAASVTHLFLTHGDVDHTGGLDLFPDARVHLSKDEEQMIDGTTPRLLGLYHSPRLGRPYTLLADGDVVVVGEIEVRAIATPGHTPGAMSYLVDGHALFTGDTLALRNGRVRTFYHPINTDTATQKASIRKLARLGGVSLLCTAHTGCTTEYARAMRQWRGRQNVEANHETE
jgi:glyoxylase-like metal-dependent hydrolase (beta-lactamase superfamily II)/protein-S-isoprenylcysteine O-methyltransferase Ste14